MGFGSRLRGLFTIDPRARKQPPEEATKITAAGNGREIIHPANEAAPGQPLKKPQAKRRAANAAAGKRDPNLLVSVRHAGHDAALLEQMFLLFPQLTGEHVLAESDGGGGFAHKLQSRRPAMISLEIRSRFSPVNEHELRVELQYGPHITKRNNRSGCGGNY